MKPSEVKVALKHAIKAKRPVFLWGPPGVGKSDVVAQVSDEIYGEKYALDREKYFIDVRMLLQDAIDFRFPKADGDVMKWIPAEMLLKLKEGLFFLDEFNAAPPLVQASGYQLILNHAIGETKIPQDVHFIAAGNRETDKAVTHRMPSPLANRFIHINFDVDPEDWVAWALKNAVRTEVIAFIRYRTALLHQFDPQKNEKAFPTPRSWAFVSHFLDTSEGLSGDELEDYQKIELQMIQGTVGEGAAAEFVGFLRMYKSLPPIEDILMNPEKATVPKEASVLYAVSVALSRKATVDNFERMIKYVNRMTDEFGTLVVRDACAQNEQLFTTRAMIEWSEKHAHVLT